MYYLRLMAAGLLLPFLVTVVAVMLAISCFVLLFGYRQLGAAVCDFGEWAFESLADYIQG